MSAEESCATPPGDSAAAGATAVEQMRRFDRLAADIASGLLNLSPEKVDERIESDLGRVCECLDVQLATLLTWGGADRSGLVVTHEWKAGAGPTRFRGVTLSPNYSWLDRRLASGTPVLICRLSDFPAEAVSERRTAESLGLHSIAWVPFHATEGIEGVIAVNTIGKERTWSVDEVDQLRLIGQIFANALERKRADLRLREAYAELESLKDRLREENLSLRTGTREDSGESDLIGRSPALERVHHQIAQVAPTDASVLLLGETGTGKGLIARAIHDRSKRREAPFVTVNCAALPESLLESELFGHEKGAFTGAVSRKLGRFETADGGTIFLDEIAELPTHLQVKLLRFLQDLEFERVGSSQTRTADVRIIAATNRDPDQMIEQGTFRSDLYFRIGVFPMHVPPLRQRRSDIPLLVWYFVGALQRRIGKKIDRIAEEDMETLRSYAWPGNVRELQNVVERAMILSSDSRLALEGLLPDGPPSDPQPGSSSESLDAVERQHILNVLEECGWRIRGERGAAERLGLKRTTLQSRMKKLGIERPRS